MVFQSGERTASGIRRVAALLTASQSDSARHTAMDIAESPEIQHAFETANYAGVLHEFRRHQNTLQNGFALAIRDDAAVASWNLPRPWATLRQSLPNLKKIQQSPEKWVYQNVEYLVATAPAESPGRS